MSGARRRVPALPRELLRPSVPATTLYVAAILLWAFGSAAVTTLAVLHPEPSVATFALAALGTLATGHGMHMLGILGHDAIHMSLFRGRYVGLGVSLFFSSASTFCAMGYGMTHWIHHREPNTADDPDSELFSKFDDASLLRRAFGLRLAANRRYLLNTIRVALDLPHPDGFRPPIPRRQVRMFAAFNLLCVAGWVAGYAVLAVYLPLVVLFAVVLPLALAIPMSGLRNYVEHADTETAPFRSARSYASPLYTALYMGNNFHLEHHLYPGVPAYRLPAVHRHLRDLGVLESERANIETGVVAPWRFAGTAHKYPRIVD